MTEDDRARLNDVRVGVLWIVSLSLVANILLALTLCFGPHLYRRSYAAMALVSSVIPRHAIC
jgi:hypothetical protein